jgi:hypothetical protein
MILEDDNVAFIGNQGLEPGLKFHDCYRQDFGAQEKGLGIRILSAPPVLMFDDHSPKQDLSVNKEPFVTWPAQMLNSLAGIDTAGAV